MNLEKYRHFNFNDYLEDPNFRNWILHPTEENQQYWEEVWQTFPHQQEQIDKATSLLKAMEKFFQPEELKSRKINEAFLKKLEQEAFKHPTRRKSKVYFLRLSIAASVLILLGLSLWFGIVRSNPMQIVATAYGEWETVNLPDGSELQLNANSQIKFAKRWKKGEDREIWLTGEAFFKVMKDPVGAKFTVFTDDLAVEVLGTAFNVNSRKAQTAVFLEEGSVKLDLGTTEQLMRPGELIVYSSEKQKITEHKESSIEKHTSWKDGSIILRDESVALIFEKLEEVFGYPIITEDEALLKSIKTVAIPMDSIDTAIPIIERTLNITIIKQSDTLLIK